MSVVTLCFLHKPHLHLNFHCWRFFPPAAPNGSWTLQEPKLANPSAPLVPACAAVGHSGVLQRRSTQQLTRPTGRCIGLWSRTANFAFGLLERVLACGLVAAISDPSPDWCQPRPNPCGLRINSASVQHDRTRALSIHSIASPNKTSRLLYADLSPACPVSVHRLSASWRVYQATW